MRKVLLALLIALMLTVSANARAEDWTPAPGPWVYSSSTRINVPAGALTVYQRGDKIRYQQDGVWKYAYVISFYDDCLNISESANFTLTDSLILGPGYSRLENPQGMIDHFGYTPTITASDGMTIEDPVIISAAYKVIGRQVFVYLNFHVTTGGVPSYSIKVTLPTVNSGGLCVFAARTGDWAGTGMIESDKINFLNFDRRNWPIGVNQWVRANGFYFF